MKKTLHIMSLSRNAGLEIMFLNYLKYMKQKNPEYISFQYVLGLNISDYFKKELNKLGVNVYNCKKTSKFDISPIKLANQIIKKENIEIIYGQNFIGNVIASFIKIRHKELKLICHEHGTSWNVKNVTSLLTKLWISKADIIIGNSKAAGILLKNRFKAPENKIKIIYNGVPKQDLIKEKKNKKRLLFAGRLDIVKSPHTLIYMMSYLIKKDPYIDLIILGEGPCEQSLQDLSIKLNLDSNIHFKGNVNNVNEYMASSMLLILPSMREALGNVTIEAAFQETPTIGTNIDGIPETIKDGITGALVEAEYKLYKKTPTKKVVNLTESSLQKPLSPSAKKIADKVLELLSDYEDVVTMGRNAREFVSGKFSMNNYYENITKLLK